MTEVLAEWENFDTDTHREKTPCGYPTSQRQKNGGNRSFSQSAKKEPTLPASGFQTSSLHNCETINWVVKPPSQWFWLWEPSQTITDPIIDPSHWAVLRITENMSSIQPGFRAGTALPIEHCT